ncbi:hypothetical protein [Saccharomonospora sp.]|uniref:hypothetical protein n=1 Tax=Saccharomonospora sp. TaxID=33913 RepID=UPI002630EF73|nr:hypothetical protein [Saccharomonospora sp.]
MSTDTALNTDRTFPLRFALPREFVPVDLTAEPAERAEKLHRRLVESLPQLTDEQKLHVLMANQYVVGRMLAEGVLYAATFLGRSDHDPTALTTAQFIV